MYGERIKLTCIPNPRFRFTPCMNLHISVDSGSACCHNFRGTWRAVVSGCEAGGGAMAYVSSDGDGDGGVGGSGIEGNE